MNRLWSTLIRPIIDAINIKYIVEIGSESGVNTRNILEYCADNEARMTAIDPFPTFDINEFKKEFGDKFEIYTELSLSRLPLLKDYDAILLDGDHNWYTVYNELKIIEKSFKDKKFPIVFLHDVGWPYARRDLYYNPENIPETFRQPYKKLGVHPNQTNLSEKGGLNPNLYNSIYENNPNNGVLTAAEDFLEESDSEFSFETINIFFGLGILYPKSAKMENIVKETIENANLLDKLEEERLNLSIQRSEYFYLSDSLKRDLRENQIQLQDVESQLNQKKEELGSSNHLIKEKEKLLEQMVSQLEQKETQLSQTINELKEKESQLKSSNESIQKKQTLINQMEKSEEKIVRELESNIKSLTAAFLELEYLNNSNKSMTQKLISWFPSLYILFNTKNRGVKNALINIKGYKAIKKNNLFDIGYYLEKNPDVKFSGADPITHYIIHGYNEGRNPSPAFDGEYYLKTHPDIKKSNLNPLVHYSLYGINEGRNILAVNDNEVGTTKKVQDRSTHIRSPASKSTPKKIIITGSINKFTTEPVVQGWLAKLGDNNPRKALLKIDNDTFEISCDYFRSDLKNQKINEGNHAFEFIVPINFIDGKKHQIQLFDQMTGKLISKRELSWSRYNFNEEVTTRLKNKIKEEKRKFELSRNQLGKLEEENTKFMTIQTYNDIKKTDSLKLNVGCGSVKFPGWVNIDIEPGADLVVNLKNGLPFKDKTADFIYNEHFIEHLKYEDGKKAVKEFYRVLKEGGVLRIATPELDFIINKYIDNWKDQDWLSWPVHSYIKTRGQMINIAMREWGHEYLYNEEDLRIMLKKAGFEKITKHELKKSSYSELSDRETREDSNLILEAEK